MIIRIVPPVIHVSDLQAAENFFRRVLELEVRDRSEMPEGGAVTHLASADSRLHFKLLAVSDADERRNAPGRPQSKEITRITLFSDDFTGDVDRLVANGAAFVDTPSGSTSRATYASFAGPEAYTIEIVAYRPTKETSA